MSLSNPEHKSFSRYVLWEETGYMEDEHVFCKRTTAFFLDNPRICYVRHSFYTLAYLDTCSPTQLEMDRLKRVESIMLEITSA